MKPEWAAALLPAAVFALLLAAVAGVLALTLAPTQVAQLLVWLEPLWALLFLVWLLAALAGGVALRAAWRHFAAAPGRLAEQLHVQIAAEQARSLPLQGSAGSRALAQAANALAEQRDSLRREMAQRVAQASRDVEQERGRLAALMAELTHSVVVCNLDGRILLFNARARLQFRALVQADSAAAAIGGSDAIALGRSIYSVLDRRLVAHALQAVQQRLARGVAQPSAQFVTATRAGQLLRVQMAAVRSTVLDTVAADATVDPKAPTAQDPAATTEPTTEATAPTAGPMAEVKAATAEPTLDGFVLMLDNITREMSEDAEREQLLQSLTEGSRGAIGNLQAAVELLDDPELDQPMRERFLGVIRDESQALARRLNDAAQRSSAAAKTRWPLEDMLGADFVSAAAQRLQAELGSRTSLAEIDPGLWLKLESFSLIQCLLHLAGHLSDEFDVQQFQLRLSRPSGQSRQTDRAQLDLVWSGPAMSTETVVGWETEALGSHRAGSDGAGRIAGALSLRDVMARHGGAFWFERDRPRQLAFFRFLLPLASETEPLQASSLLRNESRPEFYDFKLFASLPEGSALSERALADLSCTVFDTETTGLEPSAGDEIIQIGAVRVVAGKLRRQDCFETLVDPQRALSPQSIAIHGIQPQTLVGQPTIVTVLPAFHAFAQDTVLVAHNAAFDMRFLQMKEASTGLKFEQPVLDTLLLSAIANPQQDSHSLEAICQRLGVELLGRHNALGDAMVTAECFLKLVPLLQARGITTLGQALEASKQTYLARITY